MVAAARGHSKRMMSLTSGAGEWHLEIRARDVRWLECTCFLKGVVRGERLGCLEHCTTKSEQSA